jgi:hypothetical protein
MCPSPNTCPSHSQDALRSLRPWGRLCHARRGPSHWHYPALRPPMLASKGGDQPLEWGGRSGRRENGMRQGEWRAFLWLLAFGYTMITRTFSI